MDIGSAVGRRQGIDAEKLAEVSDFRRSARFGEAERAALAYAEEMTRTPVDVPDDVFQELRRHFDDDQIVELTAVIAFENLRARFNHALEIESAGLCPLPLDHPAKQARSG
jgi:alkylhydroperoxidase family enzyme